jgi:AcrR family transcriptional regulator
MNDRKKELVTEWRRAEIITAAAKVFGEKGFDNTRVDDIAAEAGLTKATIYAYFPSKDLIYEAVVDQAFEELADLTRERLSKGRTFAEKLEGFIAVRLMYWEQKRVLYRVIWSVNADLRNRARAIAGYERFVDVLSKIFEEACRAGEIPRQDFVAGAWRLLDMLRGIYDRRLHGEDQMSIDETIRSLTEFTLHGLELQTPKPKHSGKASGHRN